MLSIVFRISNMCPIRHYQMLFRYQLSTSSPCSFCWFYYFIIHKKCNFFSLFRVPSFYVIANLSSPSPISTLKPIPFLIILILLHALVDLQFFILYHSLKQGFFGSATTTYPTDILKFPA